LKQILPKKITRSLAGICLLAAVLLCRPAVSFTQTTLDSVTLSADSLALDEEEYEETGSGEKEERFRDISTTDSFRVKERQLPAGYTEKLKKDKDFWYADAELRKKEEKTKEEQKERKEYVPLGQRSWVQTLLWIVIIGGFAGAIMWYLAESNVGLFRKKSTATAGGSEDDVMPEDIFAINYQKEIDKATANGNYRLAVRMMFLRLLKELSEKNIIQYKQDRTNLDYLLQLHTTPHYPHFFRLTRHFEYSWYGHFDVEQEAYRVIAKEFDQFEKEISKS
jgi:hypothetical protein